MPMRIHPIATFHLVVALLVSVVDCTNAITLRAEPNQPTPANGSLTGKCADCHSGKPINKIKPSTHGRLWMETHGQTARWSSGNAHGKQCHLCHTNAVCIGCHRTRPPRSHTGLWNVRMHGITAKWDRERCQTCHETGACITCHRHTPPLNHRGNWISNHGRARGFTDTCTTCHNSGWCITCHRGHR